jgi:hypothetical protein
MNIDIVREPKTRAFSCVLNHGDRSCDNGVLFTMEAVALKLIGVVEAELIALQYEIEPGLIGRYPGSNDCCSWDDHTGAAAVSVAMAKRILTYMNKNNWTLPNGDYLGRFPLFAPTVMIGAGETLSVWDQIKAAAAYLYNCFEKKSETSGKIILWLASKKFGDGTYKITTFAVAIWTIVMTWKYPGGMKDVMAIYFPEGHPFREAA